MTVFIDTSAFFAGMDRDDANHAKAVNTWKSILDGGDMLVSTNYVVIESFALAQPLLGLAAARSFQEDTLPLITLEWISADIHESAVNALLAASRKNLSLVDCVSFEIIRKLGIKTVFAFDRHFKEQGFKLL